LLLTTWIGIIPFISAFPGGKKSPFARKGDFVLIYLPMVALHFVLGMVMRRLITFALRGKNRIDRRKRASAGNACRRSAGGRSRSAAALTGVRPTTAGDWLTLAMNPPEMALGVVPVALAVVAADPDALGLLAGDARLDLHTGIHDLVLDSGTGIHNSAPDLLADPLDLTFDHPLHFGEKAHFLVVRSFCFSLSDPARGEEKPEDNHHHHQPPATSNQHISSSISGKSNSYNLILRKIAPTRKVPPKVFSDFFSAFRNSDEDMPQTSHPTCANLSPKMYLLKKKGH